MVYIRTFTLFIPRGWGDRLLRRRRGRKSCSCASSALALAAGTSELLPSLTDRHHETVDSGIIPTLAMSRRSRDVGAHLGSVPRRYQSGEVDYVGSISKCGDRRVRTLLYEAANVVLTRYKGQLKLKDWAFAIAKRSTMRKARVALARRLAIIMHAMLLDGTEFEFA